MLIRLCRNMARGISTDWIGWARGPIVSFFLCIELSRMIMSYLSIPPNPTSQFRFWYLPSISFDLSSLLQNTTTSTKKVRRRTLASDSSYVGRNERDRRLSFCSLVAPRGSLFADTIPLDTPFFFLPLTFFNSYMCDLPHHIPCRRGASR